MSASLIYEVALTLIPGIGCVQAKILIDQLQEAEQVFRSSRKTLESIDGIGSVRANAIKTFSNFKRAETEARFTEKHRITTLFLTDPEYPARLLNCYDPPTLLYYKGTASLNPARPIAVIGTRNHSHYGRQMTDRIIHDLAGFGTTIVSGLAYGIDAISHRAALRENLATVAVLAHGLDTLYPADHQSLAKEMIRNGGGLLTEFVSTTQPDRHNFPTRNRIVAGMCDAVIVVETGVKGGSMITAELANGYNREVFAVPGKLTDAKSGGANQLIRTNKAALFNSVEDLAFAMGWLETPVKKTETQLQLYYDVSAEQQIMLDIIKQQELVHIDELTRASGLSHGSIATAMLELELKNLVECRPGKKFSLK